MLSLTVKNRDSSEDIAAVRATGSIPAVFYGPKVETTSISIETAVFKKVLKEAGESSVVTLKGAGEDHDVLIYDVDFDPVTGEPRHADFYVIEKGKKVTVDIPLHFEGISPAVKDMGGILVKVLHDLEIEAAPKDLPHAIVVDISSLTTFDSQILAKDIRLPAGVTLVAEPEEVVVLISQSQEETESEPVDISAIEVEKKGKKEETDAAAE